MISPVRILTTAAKLCLSRIKARPIKYPPRNSTPIEPAFWVASTGLLTAKASETQRKCIKNIMSVNKTRPKWPQNRRRLSGIISTANNALVPVI